MEGGGDPPQGRKEPPGAQVGSAPAAQAWDAHHAPHTHPYAPAATDPPANERQGVDEMEWWDAKYVMWPRQEVGKGQGRGASKSAWRPAQNANSGWEPATPGMQVGNGEWRESQKGKSRWVPRDQWEQSNKGKVQEGVGELASEAKTAQAASIAPQGPGPSPGPIPSASAPIQRLGVPQEGTTQEPKAPSVPTERGLASAMTQDPPIGAWDRDDIDRVISDLEGGTSSSLSSSSSSSSSSAQDIKRALKH